MNNTTCGTSRPLTTPEAVVLIVVIIAAALAAAGLPAVGVLVLLLEAGSLGRHLVGLRRGRNATPRPAQA
ncbi:hypothetical protein ACFQ0X_43380 [Streptomyces rectiviolaceus]|uniref:Uncharacterized protein n=1 Tax=Streptomyces rectiviolaceus TaxID=332591 RepID=A0ABP6NNC8_9ACTN